MKHLPIIVDKIDFFGDREYLYNFIIDQHLNFKYNPNIYPDQEITGYSFPVKDTPGKDFVRIYNRLIQKAYRHFPNLILSADNSTQCWCNCTSRDDHRSTPHLTPHDHVKSADINSVYYFYKTDDEGERDGAIAFYEPTKDGSIREIGFYKPKQDEVIFMPNWLIHSPLLTNSKKYRISINMEIKAEKF